jgi:predicted AlkP superfamily phosphohydrolase/phosphomutase
MLFSRGKKPPVRAVVLGLDGTPYSLIQTFLAEGRMPNLAALLDQGSTLPMRSVLPTVSSVAWTSIVTGCNPGKHNIFGFIDRVPLTHEMFIPTSRHVLARTWVDDFDEQGKRVCSIGVPATFPPKEINGVLVSGFLAPSLKGATHPPYLEKELEQAGYVIDIDAWQARVDREQFLDELFNAFDRRCETMFRFLGEEPWDLFVAHIMDTDRLHHFMWRYFEEGHDVYAPWFHRFYERVDRMIGNLVDRIPRDVALFVMSDHGFCTLKKEVHLNHWLKEAGYLQLASPQPKGLLDLAQSTRCYSLLPGRIYLSVRGREYNGSVAPGGEYESLREEIAEGLKSIRDETGEPVIERVYMREELFSGGALETSPDIVAMPARGYDLKGGFDKEVLFEHSPVCGTHTYDDAVFFVRDGELDNSGRMQVVDVLPTVYDRVGLESPPNIDGRSFLV